MPRRTQKARHRRGIALVSALAALVLLSVIIAGTFVLTNSDSRSSNNRANSTRANELAEAGMSHALGILRGPLADTSLTKLLRGPDGVANTADDGYITGYGLSAALQIPDTGRTSTWGRFYVQLIDDPADPDGVATTDANSQIVVRCRAITTDSATASIDAIIGVTPFRAVAVDGNLTINGNPALMGQCGGVHTNGNMSVSGAATVTTQGVVTSTGTTTVNGNIRDTSHTVVTPVTNQPPVDIPTLDPMSYCTGHADYYLQADGYILKSSDGSLTLSTGTQHYGFRRTGASPVVWDQTGTPFAGTYCVTGNVTINGNPGSTSTPSVVTILASGSVSVAGNPFMTPAYGGISIMAGGDVSVNGNAGSGNANYSGLVYAGSQCSVNGNMSMSGQLVCKNAANPTGSVNYVSSNSLNGNPTITYNCSSSTAFGARRIMYWYPRIL